MSKYAIGRRFYGPLRDDTYSRGEMLVRVVVEERDYRFAAEHCLPGEIVRAILGPGPFFNHRQLKAGEVGFICGDHIMPCYGTPDVGRWEYACYFERLNPGCGPDILPSR